MQHRIRSGKISGKSRRGQRAQDNGKVSSLELLQMQAAHQAKYDELLQAQQEQLVQQQQQQQQQQPTAYSQRFINGAAGVSPYSQFTNAGHVAQTPLRFAGGAAINQQATTKTGSTRAGSNADALLQQHMQRIQQELAQHQGKILPPQAPQPPSYAEQMQAAYQGYLQQQRLWDQQQQQLLQQLYETYPQIPATSTNANTQGSANAYTVGGATTRAQPQAYRFTGGENRFGAQQSPQAPSAPFYTTQQHMGFLQQQQSNVLRDQQNVIRQQYSQNNQGKQPQYGMYGNSVPEGSVLPPASYSPASQVSHVNYSSGNVNYTF